MFQLAALIVSVIITQSALAQTTLNIPVAADAFVSKEYPTVNRGSKSFLSIDNSPQKDALLKFNVSGIGAKTVQSAKLRLVASSASAAGGEFRRALSNNWTETGVTWNNAPAADSFLIAKLGKVLDRQVVDVDVTSVVRNDGTISFRISNSVSDGTNYDYKSREAGSSLQPRLIIVVASPTPTPTPPPSTPTPTPTPVPPVSAASCLDQSGPVVTVNGAQSGSYFQFSLAASTKVDMRGASWNILVNHPVKIGGGNNICSSGGTIQGVWDPYTTSWSTYHDSYAFTIYGNNMIVENLRVDNYGDAINIRNDLNTGNNFTVRNIHVTNNHDDCFQNDSSKSGLIENNLFDGCYNFYSSRDYGVAPQNTVVIRNNLVRAQGFPTYYQGSAANVYDPSQYENGGFFKIDKFDEAPKLVLHNNVFRIDKDSRGWVPILPNVLSFRDPANDCKNNVIVWLGSGAFPETIPAALKHCISISTDRAIWENAVIDWKARH
jgi:hypothetical protein